MPAPPGTLERLAFGVNAAPGVLVDVMGAGGLRVCDAALQLGVFEALHEGPRSGDDLAGALKQDSRGLGAVLEALAAFGYLRASSGRYANTPLTSKWLVRDSPHYLGSLVAFWQRIVFPYWDRHLAEAVRNGSPPRTIYAWMDTQPGAWQVAQTWFRDAARLVAADTVAAAALPSGARSLLDLGGGHGTFSTAFCRKHPAMKATIFDLPPALALTRDTLREAGMEARVGVQQGDFLEDKLGSGFDAVLMANVLHGLSPEECKALIRKAAAALAPGGCVVILDNLRGRTMGPTTRAFVPLINVVYLVALGGRVHRFEDMAGWLRDAGLQDVRRKDLLKAPGSAVVTARKP